MLNNSLNRSFERWYSGGGHLYYDQEDKRWVYNDFSWVAWVFSFFGGIDCEGVFVWSGLELLAHEDVLNQEMKERVNTLFKKKFGHGLFDPERVSSLPTDEQLQNIDQKNTYLYLENGVWKTKKLGVFARFFRWLGIAHRETRLGTLVTILSSHDLSDRKFEKFNALVQKRFRRGISREFIERRKIIQMIPKILAMDILPQEGEGVTTIQEKPLVPVSWMMGNLILSEWTGLEVSSRPNLMEPLSFFISLIDKYASHFSLQGQVVKTLSKELKKGYAIFHALKNVHSFKARRALSHAIIEELKNDKRLCFPVQYAAFPYGHQCFLQLDLQEKNGEVYVSGRLTNPGEGLGAYHQKGRRGHREGYVLELELGVVPLASLQNSNFFVIASELFSLGNEKDNTNYRIQDFYEGLVGGWPGPIFYPKDPEVRADQYGKTCLYKAILKSCKARLSLSDRRLLSFFAEYEALHLLETHQESLKQCKEGASRLCRRALKLSKKCLLSPDIVKQLREKTKQYRLAYEKMERRRVFLQNPEPLRVEQNAGAIFSIQESLRGTFWGKEVEEQKEAVVATSGNLVADLEYVAEVLQTLKSNKQYSLELNLIRQTLQGLPSVDDSFWETEEAKKVLTPLSHILKRVVVDVYGTTEGPLKFSSNSAALLIKGFVIATKITSKDLPENLVSFFKVVVQAWYVNGPGFLYHLLSPTDPYLVEEMGKAFDFLETNKGSYGEDKIFLRYTKEVMSENRNNYWWHTFIEEFEELQEILDHPQMCYLYTLLKSDPKLEKMKYMGPYPVQNGGDVFNTINLFMSEMEKELPADYTALRRIFYALYLPLTKVDVLKAPPFLSEQEFDYKNWVL